jgi:hypothetical protein
LEDDDDDDDGEEEVEKEENGWWLIKLLGLLLKLDADFVVTVVGVKC